MDAKLVVLRGADRIEIDLFLPFLIGRSSDAALKIPHESVSREHCRIYEFDGELAVRDLGSRNGTFVNGQQIDKPTFLSPGDELIIGGVTFQADYAIRRQIVLTPHEESAPAKGGEDETIVRTAAPANRTKPAAKSSTKKTPAAKRPTQPKIDPAEPLATEDVPVVPALEEPKPIVAEAPQLNTGEVKVPIVDKVELQAEEPIKLVSEDELKGFLDDLS